MRAKSSETDARTRSALDETMNRMQAIVQRATAGEAYDQMIGEGNAEGNALVDAAIKALIAQSKEFERGIAVLDLKAIQFEGSDSLDSPEKAKSEK
jgi:putative iron-regulated protein